jgi:putative ABC transport system permease protein
VAAIALVIGIGTGVYSGLGSTARWRQASNDASFDRLHMYDLRVKAAEGVDAAAGDLRAVLRTLPDPGIVEAAEERLVVPTQVDASTASQTILVPGRIIGVDVTDGGPHVNGIYVAEGDGRTLAAGDAGAPAAVLERNFAEFYDLPATGEVRVAGGGTLRYTGLGLAPEYFLVMTDEGGFFAQANFAALFLPLSTAQAVTGRPGRVNDLVLRLAPGVDRAAAGAAVEQAFSRSAAALGVTVMGRNDEDAYRVLYDDIKGDQKFWNVFAALILAGAAFGAFNLSSRMVEAQRREIGIGMALGATPGRLAARPILVGAEIALTGVLVGAGVGWLVIAGIRPVYTSMLPLPVWRTEFQPALFARGAALGFILPLLATAWPVWRAVRVTPVDAIATLHRTARGGLATLLRRLRWPASAFKRMPVGNVLRTPRRTILTAAGIGAAITTLVAILGMLDSFVGTMDRNDRQLLGAHPDRVVVALDRFVAADGVEVGSVAAVGSVGAVEPAVRLGATLEGRSRVDVLLEVVDLDSPVWTPTIRGGRPNDRSGLILAEKAAADVGVRPGDRVTIRHPVRQGDGFTIVESQMPVAGIHDGPFRFNAYLDRSQLASFGLAGVANQLYVLPSAGHGPDQVEADLFGLAGVASVQPVAAASRIVKDSLDEFTAVFRVIELFILLLAVLIAYNAASINADERARERATLFAFGLPLRRVIGLETAEGLILGAAGTAIGVGLGFAVVRWVTQNIARTTMPDMGLDVALSRGTVLTAAVLGVIAVGIAPLLTIRRLRRMDIPGTLRVVE